MGISDQSWNIEKGSKVSKEMKKHSLLTIAFQAVLLAFLGGIAGLSGGGVREAILGAVFGAVLGVIAGAVLVIKYPKTPEGQT